MDVLIGACAQGSVMAPVVLAAHGILSRHVPRWAFSLLWVLVLLRFALPIKLPSVSSFLEDSGSSSFAGAVPSTLQKLSPAVLDIIQEAPGRLGLSDTLLEVVWVIGCAVLFVLSMTAYAIQAFALRKAQPIESSPAIIEWLATHGLHRPLRVLESDALKTPVARGLLRPAIIIPKDYLLYNKPTTVKAALEHEYAHVRRFDPFTRAFSLIVACIYWFDPTVWLVYVTLSHDQEFACDEYALRKLAGDERTVRKDYANALLDTAAVALKRQIRKVGFGQSPLEKRIRNVVFPSSRLAVPGIVVVLAVAVVAASSAMFLPLPSPQQIRVGSCTLDLPSYWDGKVVTHATDSSSTVSLVGHPELVLIELLEIRPTGDLRHETDSYKLLWSGDSSDGKQYELWGLCYAGMSVDNAWRNMPFSTPDYPGEEAEELAIDLSTGGTATVEEARLSSEVDPSWFDYYHDAIVPSIQTE